jgi:hypothetical protein
MKHPVTIYSQCIGCELSRLQDTIIRYDVLSESYLKALREIDTHIRSTSDPVPYIIETLKNTLPEYKLRN